MSDRLPPPAASVFGALSLASGVHTELTRLIEWVLECLHRYLDRFAHRWVKAGGDLADVFVSLHEVRAVLGGEETVARRPSGLELPPPPAARPVPVGPRLAVLRDRFALDETGLALFAAAAAPLLHTEVARLYTFAWADFSTRLPTVGFLCDLTHDGIAGDHPRLDHFRPHAPLVAGGLVRLSADAGWTEMPPLLHAAVRVPEPVLAWLRGEPPALSAEIGRTLRVWPPRSMGEALVFSPESRLALLPALDELFAEPGPGRAVVLVGPPGCGRGSAVRAEGSRRGRAVFEVELASLAARVDAFADQLGEIAREARLRNAVLLLRAAPGFGEVGGSETSAPAPSPWTVMGSVLRGQSFALTLRHPVAAVHRWLGHAFEVTLSLPDSRSQAALWLRALGGSALEVSDRLAERFNVSPGVIAASVEAARADARTLTGGHAPSLALPEIAAALRRRVSHALASVAESVTTTLGWDDVVLPADVVATLHEIRSQARHRSKIYDDWGFRHKVSYGRGLTCLFSGPPGTGKTMMAGILAGDLGRELYRIDLSRVVSKWVGETEKNLSGVFDEAERAQVILFFDEADSLFSARTEVKGANDRFANMEVNYLLQRMEIYDGMSILATNFERGLDEAFKRRLKFRVHFPLPEAEERALLWQRMVPGAMPVEGEIRWDRLGQRFKMSGGNIKNAVLRAAFYAAEAGGALTDALLVRAAEAEQREMGRL